MTAHAAPTPVSALPDGAAVRLVVCDMDGTLLAPDGGISARTWEAIRALRAAGIVFAPASGRQYATLAGLFAEIHSGLTVIAENGTVVMRDGEPLAVSPLPHGVVPAAVRAVRALGMPAAPGEGAGVIVCTPEMAYTERSDESFLREARHYYHALEIVPDLEEIPGEAIKIAVFSFDGAEAAAAPALREARVDEEADVVVSGRNWVDVMPPGINKGGALARLRERLGISAAETMVFGDYLNDLEMLADVELSFAMANAHPDVIVRSRYIAPPNDEDGVARVLEAVLAPRFAAARVADASDSGADAGAEATDGADDPAAPARETAR